VRLRRTLFGPPIAHSVQLAHRLPIYLALPVFASDALSSVAYATEEVLRVLTGHEQPPGSPPLFTFLIPISIGITILMAIVAFSYMRAIALYPTSGGSYTVARRNLGYGAGLVAASALTIDYILTVAVSASAGIEALVSYFQDLQHEKVLLTILLVMFITFINLRGVKESGWTFALPAYAFITMIVLTIGASVWHAVTHSVVQVPPHAPVEKLATGLLWFVLAKAFSNGCSALTGVEAVSNGVGAFQPPEAKNAIKTLLALISVLVVLFLGVGFAANLYHVTPSATETVISQLARANFGGGSFLYGATIGATLLILLVAANTSFVGLPMLLALVAGDGFAPRSLKEQGDRLVYNRGIIVLAAISVFLIYIFHASVTALIPLYAVGVFICFTLSQFGIAVRIWRDRHAPGTHKPEPGETHVSQKNDWLSLPISILGGVVTGCVALVIAISKFMDGAWVVVILIPVLCFLGYLVRKHYDWFRRRMTIRPGDRNPLTGQAEPLTVVVLIGGEINRGTLEGIEFARSIVEGRTNAILRALHVEMDKDRTPQLEKQWKEMVQANLKGKIKLELVPSPFRWLILPILEYLDKLDKERYGDRIIVVIPEFETGNWFTHFLHNATSWRLRQVLMGRPHITIVTTRYFLAEDEDDDAHGH
jgi:amino acid transporter